jgi:hypothetical protein
MADPERGTKKVSQSAIDEIRKMGMGKAISTYKSGNGSAEFRTAVERYYSPQRLKSSSTANNAPAPKSTHQGAKPSVGDKTPVAMPKSAPAAASRRVPTPGKADDPSRKTPAEKLGDWGKKTQWGGLTGGKPPLERLVGNLQTKPRKPGTLSEKALRAEAMKKGMKYKEAGNYVKQERKKGR